MKTFLLFFTMLLAVPTLFAQEKEPVDVKMEPTEDRDKKIDITIKVNGYIVRIYGNANYNALTGNFTFDGHVTITGNGENSTWPVHYNGSLKKGPNQYKYEKEMIPEEDIEMVDWVLSRLYLQNPEKIWFDSK